MHVFSHIRTKKNIHFAVYFLMFLLFCQTIVVQRQDAHTKKVHIHISFSQNCIFIICQLACVLVAGRLDNIYGDKHKFKTMNKSKRHTKHRVVYNLFFLLSFFLYEGCKYITLRNNSSSRIRRRRILYRFLFILGGQSRRLDVKTLAIRPTNARKHVKRPREKYTSMT